MGYFIGLMSGTSLDGIDAALVSINQNKVKSIKTLSSDWPDSLQNKIRELVSHPEIDLEVWGQLDVLCGRAFAQAAQSLIEQSGLLSSEITAIGCHGQTILHSPAGEAPFSLQIGDPSQIAELTGVTTVAHFRQRDMAAGGQGAPLVPAFHQAVFTDPDNTRVILNIGGIANITYLDPARKQIIGYDTGPGNCLLDGWIREQRNKSFDENGAWLSQGTVQPKLLDQFLTDPYFQQSAPKSTGTETFSLSWLKQHLNSSTHNFRPEDIQASLAQLTVETIRKEILSLCQNPCDILVCGGGAQNTALMTMLAASLPGYSILTTEAAGIDPDWVEAIAFAWLAKQTLDGHAGNVPSVTGASHSVPLGAIYPGRVKN
jgi:anhydro-N-acetylmuramic acid kinase